MRFRSPASWPLRSTQHSSSAPLDANTRLCTYGAGVHSLLDEAQI